MTGVCLCLLTCRFYLACFHIMKKFIFFFTFYLICFTEGETNSKFRSFIEPVDRNYCRFLGFQNHG